MTVHPRGDGDGWLECALGHRHWGRFGAAGLLAHRDGAVLLQHRVEWSHHGGTWGLPGGARNSAEDAVTAALREAAEEAAVDPAAVAVHGTYDDVHGRWTYTTVLAAATDALEPRASGGESLDVSWVAIDEVAALPLHPGFAASWPLLRKALTPLHVVVDAANVVGSRPDGWWRDRVGAARRLIEGCRALALAGVAGAGLPDPLGAPPLARWWPSITVVVEGAAARGLTADALAEGTDRLRVERTDGSGDDAVVRVAAEMSGQVLVVTADRELRARVHDHGASVVGPRWLTDRTDALSRADS